MTCFRNGSLMVVGFILATPFFAVPWAQCQEERRSPEQRVEGGLRGFEGRPEGGPRGFDGRPGEGRGGPGGPGGMMRVHPLMVALDTNKDGVLSKEEIDGAIVALKALDKNQDGKLTEEELRPTGGPPEGFGGPGFGGRGGPPGPGGGQGNPDEMVARFLQFDANKDDKLSKEELPERMQSLIVRADTDSDGVASKEELIAMVRKAMSEGSGGFGPGRRGEGGGERGGRPGGEGRGGEEGRPGGRPEGSPEEASNRRPLRPE